MSLGPIEQVVLTIAKDGKVTVAVEGHKGGSCQGLTAKLEEALGGAKLSDDATEEFYEPEQAHHTAQEGLQY